MSDVPDNYRRALEDMAAGGHLYVYVHNPNLRSQPPEGSGAIDYDGPPHKLSKRGVDLLRKLGTRWDADVRAEVLTEEGKLKARALLDDRDFLMVSSAPETLLAEEDGPSFGR